MTCTCESNVPGVFLCHECATSFEEFLKCTVGDVVDDLTRVMGDTKLTATYGHRVSAAQKMHADLPFNVDAYDKREAIRRGLVEACTRVAQETRARFTLSTQGLTDYLLANVDHLRKRSWGPAVVHNLTALVNAGTASVALVEPKTFAGNCAECDTDLYARQGETTARCRTCGETYQVQAWQAHAGIAKEYHIGTPAELSRALTNPAYGIDVSADLIWRWGRRGKLERANPETTEAGGPLKAQYRLRDVLDLNAKRKPLDGTAA